MESSFYLPVKRKLRKRNQPRNKYNMIKIRLCGLLGVALVSCSSAPQPIIVAEPVPPVIVANQLPQVTQAVLVSQPISVRSFEKDVAVIAGAIAKELELAGIKRTVLLDLTDPQGNPSQLGRFLTELMTTDLVIGRSKIYILDRASLDKTIGILTEKNSKGIALVDPTNTSKLAQLLGVDALVVGSITPLEDETIISIRIVLAGTGQTVGAVMGKVVRTAAYDR